MRVYFFNFVLILTQTLSLSVAMKHIKARRQRTYREKSSRPRLCASCGVTLLLGVPRLRRRVVAVVLPGRGSEPCGGGDGVWGRGVAEALVPPTRGGGGGHRCGCHGDSVLGGCREEARVLGVFRSRYRTKVHLVGSTQECTTWGRGQRSLPQLQVEFGFAPYSYFIFTLFFVQNMGDIKTKTRRPFNHCCGV